MFERLEESIFNYDITNESSKPECPATQEMTNDFKNNGYIIIRNLLDAEEVRKLLASQESVFEKHKMPETNQTVGQQFWNDPGNDIVGKATGCSKILGVSETILNKGELYLYHGKTLRKQPKTEGVFRWHQDYGYWYYNEVLYPDMLTVGIALTPSTEHTGGLEMIAGSHLCGRIDHTLTDAEPGKIAQMQADIKRVEALKSLRGVTSLSLDPGDAVFFHALMLHQSGPNKSDHPRWHLTFCYNTAANTPLKKHFHAQYGDFELIRYPSTAIRECDETDMNEEHAYMTVDDNQYVHR